MEGPLTGTRVLLTRPARASEEFATLLRAQGADVACTPLIQIVPPPDERAFQVGVDAADDAHWVVFTSANGVNAFAGRRNVPLDPHTKIAAVGQATARAVRAAFGRTPDLVPVRSDARSLADALQAAAREGARIAIFAALGARRVLERQLREAGFAVSATAAYATRETPARDIAGEVARADVIVLTSGSGARALAAGLARGPGLSALRGKSVACIGPVTADEARRIGIAVAAVADEPSALGVLSAVMGLHVSA